MLRLKFDKASDQGIYLYQYGSTTVPKILREKLTEEGAEALVVLLDAVESHVHDTTLETVYTAQYAPL